MKHAPYTSVQQRPSNQQDDLELEITLDLVIAHT